MAKRSGSSRRDAPAANNGAPTKRSRATDSSDMPELSHQQLASMRRVGRPRLSAAGAREMIAIRLDPTVIEGFRKAAKRRGVGYQTLINEVLARHVPKAH